MAQDLPESPSPDLTENENLSAHTSRRGKSAILSGGSLGNERASMREAMDPANQSLGEALRLSYRLLQIAIAGLIVTFFVVFNQSPKV